MCNLIHDNRNSVGRNKLIYEKKKDVVRQHATYWGFFKKKREKETLLYLKF